MQPNATLPFELNNENFIKAWDEWLQYRKERRLPKLLPRSIQKQWDALSDLGCDSAIAAIDYSIRQGFQGIYQERGGRESAAQATSREVRPAFASLGALQMQLKQVEEDLNEIFYPGGCAFRVDPSKEKRERANRLLEQRKQIKLTIENFSYGSQEQKP